MVVQLLANEAMAKRDRVYEVLPFGLKVADDCVHLDEEPREAEILMRVLEFIIQDFPLSKVAQELNKEGYKTRDGRLWNASTVFELLPRLIETGARLFTSEEWVKRRRALFQSIQQ
jgi:hypothetical protein